MQGREIGGCVETSYQGLLYRSEIASIYTWEGSWDLVSVPGFGTTSSSGVGLLAADSTWSDSWEKRSRILDMLDPTARAGNRTRASTSQLHWACFPKTKEAGNGFTTVNGDHWDWSFCIEIVETPAFLALAGVGRQGPHVPRCSLMYVLIYCNNPIL